MPRRLNRLITGLFASAILLAPTTTHAFCGFYVSGATGDLTNNATQVVLMRSGQRTVLSMQNDYEGPPEDFALVIPVPVVLEKTNVKTLDPELFAKVDKMAAPRLVEYWEQDPCSQPGFGWGGFGTRGRGAGGGGAGFGRLGAAEVKIEAQFEVAEYEIVILSAGDSGALDRWLRDNRYNIPKGAEPVLRPYIEQGMFFFVARVNANKVRFENGRALLNPLRFHYDDKEFRLPVRLGLLNAQGPQDLVVHILAQRQRYEVANHPNATIPTNIDVDDSVRTNFGGFYTALFDATRKQQPGAVVTEYAWDASTCDPCPGPTLSASDFLTLGADVLPDKPTSGLVLTRLHARYTAEEMKEDLVFKEAPPLVGGRETLDEKGQLEQGASVQDGGLNNFQARYAIRHVWKGGIDCDKFTRGVWGGRPNDDQPATRPTPVGQTAYVEKRDAVQLADVVHSDIPALDIKASVTTRELLRVIPAGPTPAPAEPIPPQQVDADAGAAPTAATPPIATTEQPIADETPRSADKGGCTASVVQSAPRELSGVIGLLLVLLGLRRR